MRDMKDMNRTRTIRAESIQSNHGLSVESILSIEGGGAYPADAGFGLRGGFRLKVGVRAERGIVADPGVRGRSGMEGLRAVRGMYDFGISAYPPSPSSTTMRCVTYIS